MIVNIQSLYLISGQQFLLPSPQRKQDLGISGTKNMQNIRFLKFGFSFLQPSLALLTRIIIYNIQIPV